MLYQVSPEGHGLDLETSILRDVSNLEKSRSVDQLAGEPNLHLAQDPSSSSTLTAEAGPSVPVGSSGLLASSARLLAIFAPGFTSKPHPYVCALCQAILLRDFQRIRALIILGTNVTGRDNSGRMPMQCAIQVDDPEAAALLLAAGVTLKAPDWTTLPPLFQAASVGSLRVAELLLGHGADPSARNVWGQRYFVDVCLSENIGGIEFLLCAGANAMWETSSGRPLLISAVEKGNADLVQLLLRHGAKATCRDVNGASALALATEKNDVMIARILLEAGAEVDSGAL
jgi:ankyrin repeat protein